MMNDPSEMQAAAAAHNSENDFELPVDGFQGTPDEIERQWVEQV